MTLNCDIYEGLMQTHQPLSNFSSSTLPFTALCCLCAPYFETGLGVC